MKITTQFTLGSTNYKTEIEERDEMETLHKAIVLSSPRKLCNSCNTLGLDTKYFTSNKDKEGNIYINVKCSKCKAKSKLGRYKVGGYFWHEFEVYQPKNAQGEAVPDLTDEDA